MIEWLIGDCRTTASRVAPVHCILTSPPYWGLRDYGTPPQIWGGVPVCKHSWQGDGRVLDFPTEGAVCGCCRAWCGHLGAEPQYHCGYWTHPIVSATLSASDAAAMQSVRHLPGMTPCFACFVCHMVEVFDALRPVLRDDGTAWVILGDSYIGDSDHIDGIPSKNMANIPALVALALQRRGWVVRSMATWLKPNALPGPWRRPILSHETMLFLAKSPQHYFDADAVRLPHKSSASSATMSRSAASTRTKPIPGQSSSIHRSQRTDAPQHPLGRMRRTTDWTVTSSASTAQALQQMAAHIEHVFAHGGLLLDAEDTPIVCQASVRGFQEAHFATFPPELILPCLRASVPLYTCASCAAPWQRVFKPDIHTLATKRDSVPSIEGTTSRWEPTCQCAVCAPVSGRVYDPFGGSGTTCKVATSLGLDSVYGDLNEEYARMAMRLTASIQLDMRLDI